MHKTVYLLGAGFSIDAGAPSQEKIVEKIFELNNSKPYIFENQSVEKFQNFLTDTLSIPPELHNKIPLEDIFTPLDRCLLENMSFRNLSIDGIKETRRLIYYLIGATLQDSLLNTDKQYIDSFANYLVKESAKRNGRKYRDIDRVSVLSTNWDILLDNSIKQHIEDNYPNLAVVDYCCYISSFDKEDRTIMPGLEMLGMGGFNIKLLKLHGSLNWLQCPRCHRLYVRFNEKIGMLAFGDKTKTRCRHCDKNFGEFASHELVSNSIMPTFIKDLSNPQYKIIWQNAAIEISEAERIVFIGYSLPQADFEMRQLLSRMVRKDAKIEVVDFGKSEESHNIIEITKRYKTFFGNRLIEPIHFKGAKHYILNNLT